MFLSIIFLFVISVLTVSFFVGTYNESYWRKRGVKYHGGKNMVAVFWDFILKNRAIYDYFGDVYKQFPDEPAVATAAMLTPTLFIKDPVNIQHVLAENFKAFYHRGVDIGEHDKLADNVLFMNGNRWKLTRQKMTPLFTSSKLKNMYYIMDKSAKDFVEHVKHTANDKTLWAFDTLTLFTCAALGASVFGIKSDESTFNSPFLDIARDATKPTFKAAVKFTLNSLSPKLFQMLGLKLFGEHEKRFINAISYVLKERKNEKSFNKHDFPELALALQKSGKFKDPTTGLEIEPTDEMLAAQAFFFLIAGAEPSAMGMFATLYELARHPAVLKLVQAEVDKAFEDINGEINYETITRMEYLEKVLEEALRMHPPISLLSRRCTEDTVLPVGDIKVDKRTTINIPILAIHRDAKYYPHPDVFDPERFSPEMVKERPNMTFMPFGEGGRLCIGQRFAYLQMKTGLAYLLRNFYPKVDDVTKTLKYMKTPLIIRPTKDCNFYFVPRNLGY